MTGRGIAAIVTGVVLLSALQGIALADGGVVDMLEEAAGAEFHGSGVVMCTWDGDSAATTYEVTRTDGMSMISGPGGDLMAHDGISASRSGSQWYGTEVEEWAEWAISDRYSIGESLPTTRLARPATIVTVLEDGTPRVRMIIDDESRVPLATEILDGDGRVFRMAALVTFEPGAQDMPDDMPEMEEMDTIRPMASATSLPHSLGGYLRADVYDAGGGAVQVFYTDGVFSFSVFEAKRGSRQAAFERATEFAAGGRKYRRIVTPTATWVQWNSPDHSYVLMGDLPPDHLMGVLDLLPAPGERGWFVRIWRRLFG